MQLDPGRRITNEHPFRFVANRLALAHLAADNHQQRATRRFDHRCNAPFLTMVIRWTDAGREANNHHWAAVAANLPELQLVEASSMQSLGQAMCLAGISHPAECLVHFSGKLDAHCRRPPNVCDSILTGWAPGRRHDTSNARAHSCGPFRGPRSPLQGFPGCRSVLVPLSRYIQYLFLCTVLPLGGTRTCMHRRNCAPCLPVRFSLDTVLAPTICVPCTVHSAMAGQERKTTQRAEHQHWGRQRPCSCTLS